MVSTLFFGRLIAIQQWEEPMRREVAASICILIFMTVVTSTTFAQSKLKGGGGAIQEMQTGNPKVKPVPLTTSECTGLGGDVQPDVKCASGKICITKTSTGTYSQCITSFGVK
jgi:hypothetical protein